MYKRTKADAEAEANKAVRKGKYAFKAMHAHHIVMEGGNGVVGQAAVAETKLILAEHGIHDTETKYLNLMWAPNRNHSIAYVQAVLAEITSVDVSVNGQRPTPGQINPNRPKNKVPQLMWGAISKAGDDFIQGNI